MNMHPQGGVANRDQRPNAGVDVCKQHLDVCLGTTDQRVANEASGWDELIAIFKHAKVDVVVLEATGGYERGLVCALQDAGITVARVNPRQARDFAKSMGVLAKTDQVDARTLRDFADVLARHKERAKYITAMPDERRRQLAELMTRRRQLVDMRVAENNHLEHAGKRSVRSITSVLKTLDKQLAAIDREIDEHIDRHFKDQRELLDSVKGVGPVTILTLTAALPGGPPRAATDLQARGSGTAGRRLGPAQGQAAHLGRARRGARRGVHGSHRGDQAQPSDQRLLQPLDRCG